MSNSAAFIAICTSSAQGRSQLAIQTNRLSAKGPLPCNGLEADELVYRQKQQRNRRALGWVSSAAEAAGLAHPSRTQTGWFQEWISSYGHVKTSPPGAHGILQEAMKSYEQDQKGNS